MAFLNTWLYIKNKILNAHKKARNPYIDKDFSYNPFESVFNRTYVWIENESKFNRNIKDDN